MAITILAPNTQLPWSSSINEDKKFTKIFLILMVPFLISSIAIPLMSVPEKTREELEKKPAQLARVVIQKKEIPKAPPPPPKEEKKEEPKPEPKKEEPKPEPKKEEPKPEPKKEEPKPEPKKEEPKPVKLVEKAREAAQAEINQVTDALADMRESFDFSDINPELTQSTGQAAEANRNIIGNKAKASSGGINTSKLSTDTGGVALTGKQTTQVESQLAEATGEGSKAVKASGNNSGRDKPYRSDEDIRKIMDRNKGSIFSVYNRELRSNPLLEGKVVFKLVIESDGRVSSASVISSDLNDPKLERKLLIKIKAINFGVTDVLQTTLEYAFDFLPS